MEQNQSTQAVTAKRSAPESIPWLKRISTVFAMIAALAYVAAVIILVVSFINGGMAYAASFWVGVVLGVFAAGAVCSAIGAHLHGMADIVERLETLCASRTDERQ